MEHLAGHGVDTAQMLARLQGVDVLAQLPDARFWATPAGQHIADLATGCPESAAYTLLLGLLLSGGPLSGALPACGVTEAVLIAILTNFGQESVERLLASAELPDEGLSRVAKVALIVGWNCAQRQGLGALNLLDGLLCADILCQPGKGATGILRKMGMLGFAHSTTREMVTEFDPELRTLEVSAEVAMALAFAREVAPGEVGTEHLLYGLSRIGFDELRKFSITPEWIQQNFCRRDDSDRHGSDRLPSFRGNCADGGRRPKAASPGQLPHGPDRLPAVPGVVVGSAAICRTRSRGRLGSGPDPLSVEAGRGHILVTVRGIHAGAGGGLVALPAPDLRLLRSSGPHPARTPPRCAVAHRAECPGDGRAAMVPAARPCESSGLSPAAGARQAEVPR